MLNSEIQQSNTFEWIVYCLSDSRSLEDIRYIGITKSPRNRLNGHRADKSGSHKACWVRSVIRGGGQVVMATLCDGLTWDQARDAEVAFIAGCRSLGLRLTNATDGGDGVVGRIVPPEERARRAERGRGRRHSPEVRAKISAGQIGNKRPPETGRRIAAVKRMRPPRTGTFKGVYARGNSWVCSIYINGKQRHIGTFATPEEAARAYDCAAVAEWGSDVCLNYPLAA